MFKFVRSPAVLSLVVLVIQNSALVVMTKISKQRVSDESGYQPYFTSTLVLNQEVVKMIFCLLVFMREWRAIRDKRLHTTNSPSEDREARSDGTTFVSIGPSQMALADSSGFFTELSHQVYQWDTLKLLIPAVLFTMQNYLLFLALSHLDAMTFQMLSQSKLISAAVLSVVLLDKKLTRAQWMSLFLLTFGVYLSQGFQSAPAVSIGKGDLHESRRVKGSGGGNILALVPGWLRSTAAAASVSLTEETEAQSVFSGGGLVLMGAFSCILSGVSSSFAGVYFEKVVKTTAPSLAVRNIHLSLFGIPLAFISMVILDVIPPWLDKSRAPFRYWQGYDSLTIGLVFVHAIGGLLVAAVVKYADNILKGFATAIAIIVSGAYMMLFASYRPSGWFVVGCTLVCVSTILYQVFESKSISRR